MRAYVFHDATREARANGLWRASRAAGRSDRVRVDIVGLITAAMDLSRTDGESLWGIVLVQQM